MKTFIASVLLLAVLILCTVLNCAYVDTLTEKMIELEKMFPDKVEEKNPPALSIEEAEELWRGSTKRLSCIANIKYLDAVEAALTALSDFYQNGSDSDYMNARSLFCDAIAALRRSEEFSFANII